MSPAIHGYGASPLTCGQGILLLAYLSVFSPTARLLGLRKPPSHEVMMGMCSDEVGECLGFIFGITQMIRLFWRKVMVRRSLGFLGPQPLEPRRHSL